MRTTFRRGVYYRDIYLTFQWVKTINNFLADYILWVISKFVGGFTPGQLRNVTRYAEYRQLEQVNFNFLTDK